MRDLVHCSTLGHVGAVGAESQVAVVVSLRGRDTGFVVDFDVLGAFRIAVFSIACDGSLHRCVDLGVCVCLVGCGARCLLDSVGEGGT